MSTIPTNQAEAEAPATAAPNAPPFQPVAASDLPVRIAQLNEAITAAINSRVANTRLKTQLVGLGAYDGLVARLAEEDAWLQTVIDHLMLERNVRYEERRIAIHKHAVAKVGVAAPFDSILAGIKAGVR